MEQKDLALYPYISEASRYVAGLDFSLDRLISSRAMESARLRGKERVLQSIGDGIVKPGLLSSDDRKTVIELLSYPFSRILVSCIDDPYLIRLYSLKEAESSYHLLETRDPVFLQDIARDFGIHARMDGSSFRLHFTDYIRFATFFKAAEWKLVNRKLENGYVNVSKGDFAHLLREGIKNRIEKSLPVPVPEDIREACEPYLGDIRVALQERKSNFGDGSEFGSVEAGLFPPCITYAISQTQAGVNLAHSMRFAMTSFLLTVGMSVDDIMNLFTSSPDFDAEKARYQVEHIAGASGTNYKPPSCATMKTYGNCYGADDNCKKIKHPLGYYGRKLWFRNRDAQKKVQKAPAAKNAGPEPGSDA